MAAAFSELRELEAALEGARLHFFAVRELTRVATPETEAAWIRAAEGTTSREVEEMTAGHQPGDSPEDPVRPEAQRHRLMFEVSAEIYALFRDAQVHLRRTHEGHLSDGEMIELMSHAVLGERADAGTSSYQIQMTMCEVCGSASQDGGGVGVTVDATAAELAQCDAQLLRPGKRAAQEIPPATRRAVVRRHHSRCAVPGCRRATWLQIHHVVFRFDGGTHDPDGLLLVCSTHHTAVHRGALILDGTYSSGFTFHHADGSRYGTPHVGATADPRGHWHREPHALGNHLRSAGHGD